MSHQPHRDEHPGRQQKIAQRQPQHLRQPHEPAAIIQIQQRDHGLRRHRGDDGTISLQKRDQQKVQQKIQHRTGDDRPVAASPLPAGGEIQRPQHIAGADDEQQRRQRLQQRRHGIVARSEEPGNEMGRTRQQPRRHGKGQQISEPEGIVQMLPYLPLTVAGKQIGGAHPHHHIQ